MKRGTGRGTESDEGMPKGSDRVRGTELRQKRKRESKRVHALILTKIGHR